MLLVVLMLVVVGSVDGVVYVDDVTQTGCVWNLKRERDSHVC